MKAFPLLLPIAAVIIVVISANAIAEESSADLNSDIFVVGDFTYRIMDGFEGEVCLASCDSKNWDKDSSITIPDTVLNPGDGKEYAVTTIGESTFAFEPMGGVILGKNVISIEEMNFYGCDNLTSLVLNDSVSNIASGFLVKCQNFRSSGLDLAGNTHFDLLDGILYQSNTLISCIDHLSGDVVLAESTSIISDWAFYGQDEIVSVDMPNSINSIGNQSFNGCSALTHILASGVTDTMPSSLIFIGTSAFLDCANLNTPTFSDNLRMIGVTAFSGCGTFDFVSIPWDVTYIGEGAFSGCKNLQNINVDPENEKYYSTNGLLFEQQTKNITAVLLQYPQGLVNGETIDLSKLEIISISVEAFKFTEDARSSGTFTIILPSSLLEIQSYAFHCCYGLREIVIPGTVDFIQDLAFGKCTDLEKVTISEGTRYICFNAFDGCSKLTSVEFPKSVILIEGEAFYQCTSLKNIVLPDSAVHIGSHVFQDCTSLETVTIVNTSTVLDDYSLETCDTGKSLIVSVPKGYDISEDVFGNTAHTIEVQGERPYPYENWIAIAFAVLLMVGILRFIRRV